MCGGIFLGIVPDFFSCGFDFILRPLKVVHHVFHKVVVGFRSVFTLRLGIYQYNIPDVLLQNDYGVIVRVPKVDLQSCVLVFFQLFADAVSIHFIDLIEVVVCYRLHVVLVCSVECCSLAQSSSMIRLLDPLNISTTCSQDCVDVVLVASGLD